jgi:hypothetical protein
MKITKAQLKEIIMECLEEAQQAQSQADAGESQDMERQGMAAVQRALQRVQTRLLNDSQFLQYIGKVKENERMQAQFIAQLQNHLFGTTAADITKAATKQRAVANQMKLGENQ